MKIAIITGGSRGLGKNTVEHLVKKNIGVIFTYLHKKEDADSLVNEIEKAGGKAHALHLDVSNTKTYSEFVIEVKKVLKQKWNTENFDFLVNNAGYGLHASFMQTTEEDFDGLVDVHLKGTFFLTQTLVPFMNNGGRIVNISSGLARFSLPGYSAYAAMKGAVEVLTRYMARELGERKISVNTIAPGAIATDFGGGVVRDNPEVNSYIANQTALGRVGEPDDIGGAISMLLSDESGWINAQRIEVSGGMFV